MQEDLNKPDIILVDEQDNVIGYADKLTAHQEGTLHRAFSVFIFRVKNEEPQLLLQKRHPEKYHCGGLWTNTCCSHPLPEEDITTAATRRLKEEMGIETQLKPVGSFQYKASFENGLTENEFDHVLVGFSEADNFAVNPQEVAEYKWINLKNLEIELNEEPEKFTPWLLPALKIACSH